MKKPLIIAALLPLSACISFGAKPPPVLLTISSASAVPIGQVQDSSKSATITILVPVVSQALATTRVPVQASDTAIAYVAKAQWVEQPARLFARLLSDTVGAKTGRVVLSNAQSFADPGARLSGELRGFGVDATTKEAVVTYDAALIRGPASAVEKRRFEARVPVAVVEASAVGVGLNRAANQVAGEVADWVGR
ncbi:ABC-type transport auxiliary lipoprotein family protein [Sphingomonas sp. ERG5]|uniref:ABC-type transport auxiliary lipoprotein family protein n=1 Tax=Sphingomonas sp. ERG5 TaxID=1381597 RepID=UPI00054C135E|nr:ABC-type transport auxiliary lipoprotein family protein [Sphingomonas sp. ERG5]